MRMLTSGSQAQDSRFLLKPGMFPEGRIHLIGGAPHAGKSTLTAQLLRALSLGEPFLGYETSQVPAEQMGVIFTDRQWADNSMALTQMGLSDIARYSFADDPNVRQILGIKPQLGHGVRMLEACVDRLPLSVKVVVADVFTTYFAGGNIFNSHAVATHMTLLQHFLIERDLTLIGLVYGMKQKAGESERYVVPTERIIGSAPLRGSASTIAYLSTHEESGSQGYQELWIQSRQAPAAHLYLRRAKDSYAFELLPDSAWEQDEGLDLDVSPRDREVLVAIKGFLEHSDVLDEELGEGWVPARAIRQVLQMSMSTLSNHLKRLCTLGLVETKRKGRALYVRLAGALPRQ